MVRWLFGIIALCAVQVSSAQESGRQGGGGIPAELEQKRAFVRNSIEDASVAKRIQASEDEEAKRYYSLAKESYAAGLAALAGGDFTGAEKQFNEVISALGKARRRVPDVEARATELRAEYKKLLVNIESLKSSYTSYLKRSGKRFGSSDGGKDGDIAKTVESAKMYANENRLEEALQALGKAEQAMKSALGKVLGAMVFEYSQEFETPIEEYNFELERNLNYLDMIPVAIAELKPADETRQTIEDLVEQDHAAVDLARWYVEKKKDYIAALPHLRAGTGYLQLALGAAGLTLPGEARGE
jgi:hypothetical protein